MSRRDGFRAPLDLRDIVAQYDVFGSSTAKIGYVDTSKPPPQQPEVIPRALYEPTEPYLVGRGPAVCSTVVEVAEDRPLFAYDPNRYYRDLRLPWPYVDATRRDLRTAYLGLGGPTSIRLTYCLVQLLDEDVRSVYDRMPLGEQYLNDVYVQDRLKARAAAESAARTAAGVYVSPEQVLDDWGYDLHAVADTEVATLDRQDRGDVIDNDQVSGFDEGVDGWGYAYYRWRTMKGSTVDLVSWQQALVRVLSEHRVTMTFAVGVCGRQPHPYVVGTVANTPVFYLNKDQPMEAGLAERAVEAFLA